MLKHSGPKWKKLKQVILQDQNDKFGTLMTKMVIKWCYKDKFTKKEIKSRVVWAFGRCFAHV